MDLNKVSEHSLVPFDTSVAPSIGLSVKVDRRGSELQVIYQMTGEAETIALPSINLFPERRTGLWEMTCFEFFLAVPGTEGYWEINLSPAGHWNVFRLDGYRSGFREEKRIVELLVQFPVQFPVQCGPALPGFSLKTVFDLNLLGIGNREIDLSVTAVIAEVSGAVSYWALCHRGKTADFHLRDSFVMTLGM